jgi:hypothetical protein
MSQTSLSFYHLGDATFQNSNMNPAFVPSGKVMLGLPGMSGVHLNYNNKLSYNDIITKTSEGTQEIDTKKALFELQRNNMLSGTSSISLFHLAFATKTRGAISFFANERVEGDFLFSEPFMRLISNGNAGTLGEEISLSNTRGMATYFREIGVGYVYRNDALRIKLGGRFKYLQGFANMSTPENMKATVITDNETYAINARLENAVLRSSGMNILNGSSGDLGSHLISNRNRGAAIDLCVTYNVNEFTSIAASLVDVGFISWKEDIENRGLADTVFNYDGINLIGVAELEDEIRDSLINKFYLDKSYEPYSSILSPKIYFSAIHHLRPGRDIITSFGGRYIQNQFKVLMGVGVRQQFGKWFTGSLNITRLPQQFINLGAAVAVKGGPVQFYLAADQIAYWNMAEFKSFDLRVGVNFIFNGKVKDEKPVNQGGLPYFEKFVSKQKTGKGKSMPNAQSFLGKTKKVRGMEGIYNLIKRQKRRSLKEINKKPGGERKIQNAPLPRSPKEN